MFQNSGIRNFCCDCVEEVEANVFSGSALMELQIKNCGKIDELAFEGLETVKVSCGCELEAKNVVLG